MLKRIFRFNNLFKRQYSSQRFSFKNSNERKVAEESIVDSKVPARTRFAPSPTGFLHLGSLRTALYNYLLAKNTGGQFILRLEDTDQKRVVSGAEDNIYATLGWCGFQIDEGPTSGGPYGPYRQSERVSIYKTYADMLLKSGHAYRCNCSKERLNDLRESASRMKPPTTATYDRRCYYSDHQEKEAYSVVRFKSPDKYEPFDDFLHGRLNLQPQINESDRRYDDFVILKSDGLPTYHFANVIDDHLMGITHVIRGEEWLPATPKHRALYRAFGWDPPSYIHIPLLTSLEDKKLSKRSGEQGILTLKKEGILLDALLNFCALFGWSPPRPAQRVSTSEVMDLSQLVEKFSLRNLTKGNAKVSDTKLYFLNKNHLERKIRDPIEIDGLVKEFYPFFRAQSEKQYDEAYFKKVLTKIGGTQNTLQGLFEKHSYLFNNVKYASVGNVHTRTKEILKTLQEIPPTMPFDDTVQLTIDRLQVSKKDVFHSLRFALSGGVPGLAIPLIIEIIGDHEYRQRLNLAIKVL